MPPGRRDNNDMTIQECSSFIHIVSQCFDRAFLVFDALDECPVHDKYNNEQRLKIIAMIRSACQYATIFVTSRPHIKLAQEIADCVCMEVRATEGDLRAYIKARVADHRMVRTIVKDDLALESHLEDRICSNANGM